PYRQCNPPPRNSGQHRETFLDHKGHLSEVGHCPAELSAGADAELAECLVQVVLDGARAQEQLGADLRVRIPLTGEPGDLRFLPSELPGRLVRTLAYGLACGQQLPPGAFGEPVD